MTRETILDGHRVTIAEYQTQSGTLTEPSGGGENGRIVIVYNSTLAAYYLFVYMNSVWRFVELTGVIV